VMFAGAVRIFLCVFALAGIANVLSYFVLSDGFGIRVGNDGIIRAGWPFLVFERGGIDGGTNFILTAHSVIWSLRLPSRW